MFATLLKTEFLKYGRSSLLPMVVIFYDAILAFVMILFMYSGAFAYKDYAYYSASSNLNHFLVLSSIEIVATLLVVPIVVSIMYNGDQEHYIGEQLALIPGATWRHTFTKVVVPVILNMILFASGLPVLLVACIYSDTSFFKIVGLTGIVLAFSLWSAAITTFFYTIWKRWGGPVIIAVIIQLLLSIGTVFIISMVGNYYGEAVSNAHVPAILSRICLILLLLNPLCLYIGLYSNLTGDISLMSGLCGPIGIDSSSELFSNFFYKVSLASIIIFALLIVVLACWSARKTCIRTEKMIW